jgi:hypothetical protein
MNEIERIVPAAKLRDTHLGTRRECLVLGGLGRQTYLSL